MKQYEFPETLKHVAIIMDGNGRWAKERGRFRVLGHRRGAEVVRKIVNFASNSGLKHLSLFTFSEENWNRPKLEVATLMKILKRFLKGEKEYLISRNIRFNVFGNRHRLSTELKTIINQVETATRSNTGMFLNVFLSYGGRQEILNALNTVVTDVLDKKISVPIDEDKFKEYLYTSFIPDPDLLIRTSGEYRISNFMIWQLAYTEFYTTSVLWPDFTENDLIEAVESFKSRDRRFGRIKK